MPHRHLQRILILLALVATIAAAACADGLAYGRGFTAQLLETHQLAVIHLTPTTADVSMFIAIQGIPAGQEITYILPFWYRPDGFTLTEDDASAFRTRVVDPAHAQVERMARLTERKGSNGIISAGFSFIGGLATYVLMSTGTFGAREKGRAGLESAPSTTLLPYAVTETAHARVALFNLGTQDLQTLVAQSGLPTKYLQPLRKYHTPHFAVIHLKGLTTAERTAPTLDGRGICYHFTHQLTNGHYSYPLGTGAAWPQPIPITEVYLTCTPEYGMQVTAPEIGDRLRWNEFRRRTRDLMSLLATPPDKLAKLMDGVSEDDARAMLGPKTGSVFTVDAGDRPSAWQIAYMQSNPTQDIDVQLSPHTAMWRYPIAEFFARPGVATAACLLLYFLSWYAVLLLVIRRRWRAAGSPEELTGHGMVIFLKAQLVIPALATGVVAIIYGVTSAIDSFRHPNQDNLPTWWGILLVLFIVGILVGAVIRYARAPAKDWRKWLTLTGGLCATAFFVVATGLLYLGVNWCETL